MSSKYKLLILDCDGTLITSEVLNNTAVSKALDAVGFPDYSVEYCIDNFQGMTFRDIHKHIEQKEKTEIDKGLLSKLITRFSYENIAQIAPVDNADKLLEQVKIPAVVASNGHREFVFKYLDSAGLLKYFNLTDIFTHDQVNHPKPAPDLFLYAAEINNVNAKDAIVVEDSVIGITAAKAAGMYAVGFVGAYLDMEEARSKLIKAGADIVIEDLLDVMNVLSLKL